MSKKKKGCPSGSHLIKGRCRTNKEIKYHGRIGHPVLHVTEDGRKYIMVRSSSGGTKRLYDGSKYRENGNTKTLRI